MKRYKKFTIALVFFTAFFSNRCSDLLNENPRYLIPPSFLNSPDGILGGVAGVYNDIRNQWGTEGWSTQMCVGTDEHLTAASAQIPQFYNYNGILPANMNNGVWNVAYQDINTLNGILGYAKTLTFPPVLSGQATQAQLIAQIKFLRAFWNYYLVQTFGSVPLHTTFITTPTTSDAPAPIADLYAQMVTDLTEAIVDLPNQPAAPFLGKAAAKGAAKFLLAKVYLARGWSSAAVGTDYANALATCQDLITNKGTYGFDLWADYADAFKPINDYGKETVFVSDHSADPKYGKYILGSSGDPGNNLTPWFNRFNYPTLGIGASTTPPTTGTNLINGGVAMMTRDVPNGRPYIRTRPNTDKMTSGPNSGKSYILDQAFVNQAIDTRYDKTFQTVWISNTSSIYLRGQSAPNGATLTVGVDTAIWIPPYDVVGAPYLKGTWPFKGIIIPPRLQNNTWFPAVKKFDDPSRASMNDPSTRPVVMWRFAEVYLIAAEAAVKMGDNATATTMVNVIRSRAAYQPAPTSPATVLANQAAIQAATPATVTIDFVLDERTREFYGEWMRWWDLTRTQTLVTRNVAWNKEAAPNVKTFHMLRPIPQDQIDRTTSGTPFPQNNGYQ